MSDFDFDKIVAQDNTYVAKSKNYKPNEWYVTVRLSDFLDAREETIEDGDGEEVLGIFIPYKHNGITKTSRNNVLCTFKASLAERSTNRYTHVLRQMMDIVDYQYRDEKGFKVPMIGHMRPTNFKEK